MATLGEEMATHKVIIDTSTEGTTYIGTTVYPRPGFEGKDSGYTNENMTADPIRRIRKFVEDDSGITEMFYPNGDTSGKYVRDSRTTYNYL